MKFNKNKTLNIQIHKIKIMMLYLMINNKRKYQNNKQKKLKIKKSLNNKFQYLINNQNKMKLKKMIKYNLQETDIYKENNSSNKKIIE